MKKTPAIILLICIVLLSLRLSAWFAILALPLLISLPGLFPVLCYLRVLCCSRRDLFVFACRDQLSSRLLQTATAAARVQGQPAPLAMYLHQPAVEQQGMQTDGVLTQQLLLRLAQRLGGRRLYLFINGADEDEKLALAATLLALLRERLPAARRKLTRLCLLSADSTAAELLTADAELPLVVLDPFVLGFYKLLFEQPLYRCLNIDGSVSVLVVGSGRPALSVVKALLWCGQLVGRRLKLRLIHEQAAELRAQLAQESPELSREHGYDLEFYSAALDSDKFEQALLDHGADAGYIVVCSDDGDAQACALALRLRRFYLRRSYDLQARPQLAVYIQNEQLAAQARASVGACHSFGADVATVLSLLDDSGRYLSNAGEWARLALRAHAVWERDPGRENIWSGFLQQSNFMSSLANAVHLRYKLFCLGLDLRRVAADEDLLPGLELFAQRLAAPGQLDGLVCLEHQRWSAFERGRGFCQLSLERSKYLCRQALPAEMRHLQPQPGVLRDRVYQARRPWRKQQQARLHACLCPEADLSAVADYFDPLLKDYDRKFIVEIPDILGDRWQLGGGVYQIIEQQAQAEE